MVDAPVVKASTLHAQSAAEEMQYEPPETPMATGASVPPTVAGAESTLAPGATPPLGAKANGLGVASAVRVVTLKVLGVATIVRVRTDVVA